MTPIPPIAGWPPVFAPGCVRREADTLNEEPLERVSRAYDSAPHYVAEPAVRYNTLPRERGEGER
jgi:hypothetical protein